jgi:hypothetical protein
MAVEDASSLITGVCDIPATKTRVFNVVEGEYSWRQVVETIRRVNPQTQDSREGGGTRSTY